MIAEKELTFWIAADLQDPPEILTEMKEYIENGFEVVWGLRAERKDPVIRKMLTGIFYKFLNETFFKKSIFLIRPIKLHNSLCKCFFSVS